jgi:TRAP-type mannitol/chloroaromatic compound transport system permease large subunit
MAANEVLAVLMFLSFIALVFSGFPVAWLLGGLAVIFSALAIVLQVDFNLPIALDWSYTSLSVERIWNVMENWVMVALPMFILMGLLLDRSGIANQLMTSFARLFGSVRGGLAVTVAVIGLLLAATTGGRCRCHRGHHQGR